MPFIMTLGDLEGHSSVTGLIKCNSCDISHVSTDMARRLAIAEHLVDKGFC